MLASVRFVKAYPHALVAQGLGALWALLLGL
jgi:hypothetical protein